MPIRGRRHRVAHAFTTTVDGTSVVDPDAIVDEVTAGLDALAVHSPGCPHGSGWALDTFASSLVGVTADQRAATLCFTYADSRCAPQVRALPRELDESAVQQRTGRHLHSSSLAPRLRCLRDSDPRLFARVRTWLSLSLGEYIHLKLLGQTAVGTSTAAWSGLLDRHTAEWDDELVAAAGIEPDQLSQVQSPDSPPLDVSPVQGMWPALAGAAWLPVLTDGYSSNVGVGAVDARL